MPSNTPYDDFLKNLAQLVEEIMKNIPDRENARFVECTIITGSPSEMPTVFHIRKPRVEEIQYEVIDSDDTVFITARIPPDTKSAAYADVQRDHVGIIIGDQSVTIPLEQPADVIHSFYMVRHGVMDIIVRKKKPE